MQGQPARLATPARQEHPERLGQPAQLAIRVHRGLRDLVAQQELLAIPARRARLVTPALPVPPVTLDLRDLRVIPAPKDQLVQPVTLDLRDHQVAQESQAPQVLPGQPVTPDRRVPPGQLDRLVLRAIQALRGSLPSKALPALLVQLAHKDQLDLQANRGSPVLPGQQATPGHRVHQESNQMSLVRPVPPGIPDHKALAETLGRPDLPDTPARLGQLAGQEAQGLQVQLGTLDRQDWMGQLGRPDLRVIPGLPVAAAVPGQLGRPATLGLDRPTVSIPGS